MQKLTGNEIRATFLRYFSQRGHRVVPSSSLVPANDPTLLFANAGMNQFKDVFLGLEHRDYLRATSCQKCVRAGGKHNDLENVGFTNRHHTFFEMLGNFSFGDYFKQDAIAFAWELVTSPNWFGIPVEKLYFTVFGGADISPEVTLEPDHDAAALWVETGAPKERVIEIPGLKENFWQMGDTGPCGPCSEIHFDMGPAASEAGHTDCSFPCDCGRYVEIWNLVFMQFNRDASGGLDPLPKPSVDTGMGLERVAAVLEGVVSNYDTDLFVPLMKRAAELCGLDFRREEEIEEGKKTAGSLRVIADHARAATFLVSDGVIPSNEGRGYVLRKIIRRALRHAHMLNAPSPFLSVMSGEVRNLMKDAYPELEEHARRVERVLDEEESRFTRTVNVGLEKLDDLMDGARREAEAQGTAGPVAIAGRLAFQLYDTYGLPRDFIEDVTRDSGITVDWAGFDRAMEEQRARAKASWKGAHKEAAKPVYMKLRETFKTEPNFYFGTRTRDARIEAIVANGEAVVAIPAGAEAEVILDRTTIYAESGGQVADQGAFLDDAGSLEVAEVRGAYYPVSGLIAHKILAREALEVGDRVTTVADPERRIRDMRNHTATHLVHAALRSILGTHVKQAGSLVAPDHLRFDFSHFAQVDASELRDIEQQVNEAIVKNLELRTDIMNIEEALASGALAFFGDKYPEDNVRVVTIPDAASPRGFYSKELCGGTHVTRTGDIGVFKIVGEQSTAAGVRRIEAISGDRALSDYQRLLAIVRDAATLLDTSEDGLVEAITHQLESTKQLEKQLEAARRKSAGSQAEGLLETARKVKEVPVVAARVSGVDRENLRQMVDALRHKLGSGVVVLATADDDKVALVAGVTKDLVPRLHAGKIVQEIARMVGGSGGGRPDLAEAGGKDPDGIDKALGAVYPTVERML
ncbi:MAG TPA: alanine--tRNA ligase [Candidatus Cybelea sp.]|nr:alanine--tRNA ligase [Candidatus Cybelea sp.]